VPLSEHEQRILEEIEKNLYQEDPNFAREVRKRAPRMDEVRRVKLGTFIFVCGFALLIAFFVSTSVLVGVAAFGAMVGGIVLVAGSLKSLASGRREGSRSGRDWLEAFLQQWEKKLRKRYKRR
jgi:Flp pilus assembly protein TadB